MTDPLGDDATRLLQQLTPGDWRVLEHSPTLWAGECMLWPQVWGDQRVAFLEQQNVGAQQAQANAAFIAKAPQLVRALLEDRTRLREALQQAVNVVLDFSERKQEFTCFHCGSERGEYGRLHKDGCIVYRWQELLEAETQP
jgi:hypothetical protein